MASEKSKNKNDLILLAGVTVMVLGLILAPVQPNKETSLIERTDNVFAAPVLGKETVVPQFSAKAVYAFDLASGKLLFSKNAVEPLLPASTTKIATALVALAHYDPGDLLTVDEESVKVDGKKMELTESERISVNNLIYGLLVFSANDAAEVLARNYPGGRTNFIAAMNRLVQEYGLEKTYFANPTGLDEYLHFSTARDLAVLASSAMQNSTFAEIAGTPALTVASADGKTVHKLVNVNELLEKVPGVLGVKTGWTINAGEALVTLVERDGRRVVISVLGSNDRFGETEELIEWIFESYSWEP